METQLRQRCKLKSFSLLLMAILGCNVACHQECDEIQSPSVMNDAEIVKKHLQTLQTRASDALTTVLITTKSEVAFNVERSGDIIVDWGDGCSEINKFSHTYTDDVVAHTIRFLGNRDVLRKLVCSSQEIIFLDVTKDTLLRTLNCEYNRLTGIDLSRNKKLDSLYCSMNRLIDTDLDVTNNVEMRVLYCYNNGLKKLDTRKNSKLKVLVCHFNQLKEIYVDSNLFLTDLSCGYNRITTLDVTRNSALLSLECEENFLSVVDVSSNFQLTDLFCQRNQLVDLIISKNRNLVNLDCSDNKLEILLLPANSGLSFINCYGNPFENYGQRVELVANTLPDRTNMETGMIFFSSSTLLDEIQAICDAKNWWAMN